MPASIITLHSKFQLNHARHIRELMNLQKLASFCQGVKVAIKLRYPNALKFSTQKGGLYNSTS